jgi:phage baseplate assembly protein W
MEDPIMIGFHAQSGRRISGISHVKQSIFDILTTPIGSRIMSRDYGCYLFKFIDDAANPNNQMQLMAVIADAILKWEPRVVLQSVQIKVSHSAQIQVELGLVYMQQQENILVQL